MRHHTLQKSATLLMAVVLCAQSAIAVPLGCACGADVASSEESCCGTPVVVSSCCGQAESCCPLGDCTCSESNASFGCGCNDQSEQAPFAPVDKSESKGSDAETSLAVTQSAVGPATQFSTFRPHQTSIPYDRSGPHSLQVLYCIWRT